MPEELKHLLKRIRTEAVEVSEEESSAILEQAREKASEIVKNAEREAEGLRTDAKAEARLAAESGTRALEQAGRDLLISVGQGVQRSIEETIGAAVEEAYGPEFLQDLIVRVIDAYVAEGAGASEVEIRVPEDEVERLADFIAARYQDRLSGGVNVSGDGAIRRGFRLSFDGAHAFHDFSAGAIADALAARIRPRLAEIIHRVARDA